MTLQVIKAEDVRDGEPRLWIERPQDHRDAPSSALHTGSRRDVGCQSCEFAIVDRPAPHSPPMPGTGAPRDPARIDPILARLRAAWHRSPDLRLGQLIVGSIPIGHLDRADAIRRLFNAECHEFGASGAPVEWPAPPTAQPPPVLDLDALAEAERAMTAGPWKFANNTTCGIIGPDSRDLKAWHWHKSGDGADRRGVVALRNAAPHLIAEARAAVALRAEIARLTAELAAARAVPPDVEEAIKSTVDGAEEAGRCAALGHAYLITKAPCWTVPRLKAAIARAISDATASQPATVGGLLATAPVGAIVEWLDGDGDWNQAVALVDDRIPCAMHRWWMAGRWCQYGGFDDAGRHLRLPARLVPAHLADADPATRGPIGEVPDVR